MKSQKKYNPSNCFMKTLPSLVPRTNPWTENVNLTYIRRSEGALDVFLSSYVHSIYILCPRVGNHNFLENIEQTSELPPSD